MIENDRSLADFYALVNEASSVDATAAAGSLAALAFALSRMLEGSQRYGFLMEGYLRMATLIVQEIDRLEEAQP